MAFSLSNMRFWFLNDNESLNWTSYQTYRNSLKWRLWNKRMNDGTDGIPSDNLSFADPLGYQGSGRALKFLTGDYKSFNPISNVVPANHNDYIIDSTDALILGNNPLWQYTWIAIQNLSSNPDLFRFELISYTSDQSEVWQGQTFKKDLEYTRIKPIGLFPNTYAGTNDDAGREVFLNNLLLTGGTFGNYFPHMVSYYGVIPYSTSKYQIFWNACAENSALTYAENTNYGRVRHGYNNQLEYYINESSGFASDGRYYPYQVCGWANEDDTNRNRDGGQLIPDRTRMLFDIPPNHTLFCVVCKTRDMNKSQYGASSQNVVSISPKTWTFSDIRHRFSYIMES